MHLTSLFTVASLLASHVAGHGYMLSPEGRTRAAFGDPNDEFACDSDQPGPVSEYYAGEEVEVVWNRNSHIGGFIRYALVPNTSVSKENFDSSAFFYTCRESQCSLKNCDGKFCGDDDGAGDNGITCRATIKLPDYVDAGDYVLQWTWHAAGSSYGHIGYSTSNFKTCADIRITTRGTGTKPQCPTFVGGDRVTMAENGMSDEQRVRQCFYFAENGLGKGYLKFSDDEGIAQYKLGVPKEIEECGGGGGPASVAGNWTVSNSTNGGDSATSMPVNNSTSEGTKGEWEFCSSHAECANNCCSNEWSDDGKLKCTPNGC